MHVKRCPALCLSGLVVFFLLAGGQKTALGDEDLSQKTRDTVQSVEHSVSDTLHKTGEYLKSERFHQDLKKAVDGTANAIQKGGNWVGHKLDQLDKHDPGKP
ncbi:hypothetical protein [Leptospirillum ferriphilum]|uniref:hypothetical protein n=1 Tax=Leptospirillum ferriphilum TaxID=178606 RepID=UPI000985419E|nr:hypothetical protein [Leptospirillum ferriphilum]